MLPKQVVHSTKNKKKRVVQERKEEREKKEGGGVVGEKRRKEWVKVWGLFSHSSPPPLRVSMCPVPPISKGVQIDGHR